MTSQPWEKSRISARVYSRLTVASVPSTDTSLLFELDGAHLAYAVGINAQRDILTNREVIAVNQDSLGVQGYAHKSMFSGVVASRA